MYGPESCTDCKTTWPSTTLLETYPAMPYLDLFGNATAAQTTRHLEPFLGPTWMDDTAICLSHPDTDGLVTRATQTAGKLLGTLC